MRWREMETTAFPFVDGLDIQANLTRVSQLSAGPPAATPAENAPFGSSTGSRLSSMFQIPNCCTA